MNTFIRRKMIECMRRQAMHLDLGNRCQRIAELIGLSDEEFLPRPRSLGHTREEVLLAHLAPLVQTAWADGRVSGRERTLIINACRALGLAEGSPSFHQLMGWLDERPPEVVLQTSLRLLSSVIQALPQEKRGMSRIDILSLCVWVAEASGGLAGYLGGARTSREEQKVIKLIAEMIHGARATPSPTQQAAGASGETTWKRRVA